MHTYLFGQDDTKIRLLEQNCLARIREGCGVFFVDAHGHSTERLLHLIPQKRRKDVILFDPSREEVCGFNPLSDSSLLSVSILSDTFKSSWGYGDVPTPQMDMFLFFSLMVLAENKQTLADFPRLLSDKKYRQSLSMSDTIVKDFWRLFDDMTAKEQRDQVASTLNKALMLVADARVRKALSFSSFTLSDVVKGNKILFVRLPQGQLSKGRTALLGSVFLSLISQAILSRETETAFHLFIPSCHLYDKGAQKELLVSASTYNVWLTVANEYIDQLAPDHYAAIIANCREQLVFRLSQDDAKRLVDRQGQWKPEIFTDLHEGRFRKYPVMHGSDFVVDLRNEKPHPRSFADIAENHRRNLWG